MDDRQPERRCSLCRAPLSDSTSTIETATGTRFCSTGCRDVDEALPARSSERTNSTNDECGEETGDGHLERTHLRVDGMHSATCEAYLESIAESTEGVERAEASYVAQALAVDHDPDRIPETELEGAVSRLGYTAYRREEADLEDRPAAGDTDDQSTGRTRRSREMSGVRKRRSDDVLEMRYVAGVVFGTFLLVPYATVFYPVYLSAYSSRGVLAHYQRAFASLEGALFLPVLFVLTGAVLLLTGWPLLRGAYVGLKLRQPNAHLLAALTILAAYVYGTFSLAIGRIDVYYDLTIVVAALVMAAVFADAIVKRRSMDQLVDLTVSQVDEARRLATDGSTRSVPVGKLEAGDRVLVREGERMPIDGTLLESECTVDEAVVTGESLPVSVAPGEAVVGGSLVVDGSAVVDVGGAPTSRLDQLTETVWDVQSATHGMTRHGNALAARLVPVVLGAAVLAGVVRYAAGAGVTGVTTTVLLAVVVASPWALALATPVTVAASVRESIDRGIVVFDETVFERLRDVDVVVFDKTGTLTTGEMTVREADAPEELLAAAAALEGHSSHPVAEAIADAFGGETPGGDERTRRGTNGSTQLNDGSNADRSDGAATGGSDVTRATDVGEFRSHATGVEGIVADERVVVGHPDLVRERTGGLEPVLEARIERARENGGLPVVVGRDGRVEGLIVVGDEPRGDWERTVASLYERGVDVVVLTGDAEPATERFEDHPGVDHVFAAVPPNGKTAAIERLKGEGQVAMVGDGTNDAPALAEADLGISLGGGTALASDAADLAIVDEELRTVERAFDLASAARGRLRQNLGLALVYNAVTIPLAVAGLLNPLFVTAAAVVSATFVAGNASRALVDR
ncbi:heavy metal translocating P-type ATPase [Natrarchaeobius sp. A-rgal3]|uniref:heavy metal translocating P-type ATPase n=1 Tax=Natrarchaeobius versutus TaxID=1679078 RepID=UPI00350FE4F1